MPKQLSNALKEVGYKMTEYQPPFKLTQVEIGSVLWDRLKNEYLIPELDRLRLMNDSVARSETETAYLRGRIKQIKELLDVEKSHVGITAE